MKAKNKESGENNSAEWELNLEWDIQLPDWDIESPEWKVDLPEWDLELPEWDIQLPDWDNNRKGAESLDNKGKGKDKE